MQVMQCLKTLAETAIALSSRGKITLIAELGELEVPHALYSEVVLLRVLSNATKATPDIINALFSDPSNLASKNVRCLFLFSRSDTFVLCFILFFLTAFSFDGGSFRLLL